MEHPFWSSVGIIFVLFGLAHVVLARVYRLGARPTLVAGIVCGAIVIGLMVGYIGRHQAAVQLSGALWFVLLAWSFIEVAKKAFHLKLW